MSRVPDLAELRRLDLEDPLRSFRDRFELPPDVVYLDGNSLGALPTATRERLAAVVGEEWGRDLIRSWNVHDWIGAPQRVGDKIARLIGAEPGEVIVADSTSVNLFKLVVAALGMRPDRREIVSEAGNFPTDVYVIEGVARLLGGGRRLRLVPPERLLESITRDTALVVLTHVHYKSAAMHDMRAVTAHAHEQGALVLWDLCHSAGAVEVDLGAAGADMAVGCGYKYLNGGPGAPALLYLARRHQASAASPLCGWMGHARPFDFVDSYAPAGDLRRFLCGTPPVLGLAALDASVDLLLEAGMDRVAEKSRRLGDLFIALVEAHCAGSGLTVASPREAHRRGSHVALVHPDGYAIMQALIERGVIGDFRAPDVLRFGFTPLYLRYEDIWHAVMTLRDVLASECWRGARYRRRAAVT